MNAEREAAARLYRNWQEWKIRLYDNRQDIPLDYLAALRSDMQQALEQVEQEIARKTTTPLDPNSQPAQAGP